MSIIIYYKKTARVYGKSLRYNFKAQYYDLRFTFFVSCGIIYPLNIYGVFHDGKTYS